LMSSAFTRGAQRAPGQPLRCGGGFEHLPALDSGDCKANAAQVSVNRGLVSPLQSDAVPPTNPSSAAGDHVVDCGQSESLVVEMPVQHGSAKGLWGNALPGS
jgi:hypothetical protein